MENIEPSPAQKEHLDLVVEFYSTLEKAYWQALANTQEREMNTKQLLEKYTNILSTHSSTEALELIQFLTKEYKVVAKWNSEHFNAYKKAIWTGKELELLKSKNSDTRLLAFLSAINFLIKSIQEVYQHLIDGKGTVEGDLFIIPDVRNPIFTENLEDLEEIKTTCYSQLIKTFEEKVNYRFADKKFLFNFELNEFSRLFSSHKTSADWSYLKERLYAESEDEIEEFYQSRIKIIDGSYLECCLEIDDAKRILYGKMLAIKEYLRFLNEELNKNQKTNSGKKVVTFPELLLNPKHIPIINEWLEKGKFIRKIQEGGNITYQWIGKMENEKYSIVGYTAESSLKTKTRKFSLPNQIAAFGYWLNVRGLLNLKIYIADTVANAILNYYNIEASESNIKAFTLSNELNLELYAEYYKGLINEINEVT